MGAHISIRQFIALIIFLFYALIGLLAWYDARVLWALALLLPLHLIYWQNIRQGQHAILRNYPLLGYLRYFFEGLRPELRQYFFESDLDGKPFSRRQRALVYQRAKNVRQTVPFGMQSDSQELGFEWIAHTMFPVGASQQELRVTIGGSRCYQPYSASLLNISAMSYGALSKTAVTALSGGARLGNFALNTGEGGVSPYHLEGGADLIWQIGTGYFGCRDQEGFFSEHLFSQQVAHPHIKMVEIKLSQGAKPGLGGILPAAKNTPEIADIRKVQPFTTVESPSRHTAFSQVESLLGFIEELRQLSGGKPVGIKLCIGNKQEVESLCQAMVRQQLFPDFITIDGAEGGTGAAPLEFADGVGMPLYDALAFTHQMLLKYNCRQEVKLIAAGKIITGMDILKARALGADVCYSARGMMFALGCIQALQCDSGRCPVGIATQDKSLFQGLDIADKRVRVASFHRNTLLATTELMNACGFRSLTDITPDKIFRRVSPGKVMSFSEIYFSQAKSLATSFINQQFKLN